jgi:glutathione S-transferase
LTGPPPREHCAPHEPAPTGLDNWASFSPYVLQVDRALKLAKLPFEKKNADMLGLRKLNRLGQLPVLEVGGEKVADSTRIMHRIEELAPGSMTGGLDARAVAEAWLWEEFSDTALYPYVLMVRWADDRGWPVPKKAFFGFLPPVLRDVVSTVARRDTTKRLVARDFTRAGLDAGYQRMGRVLDHLEARAPEEGFWVGARPTVADVGLFGQLHSLRLPLFPHAEGELKKRTRLWAWLDRVDAVTR